MGPFQFSQRSSERLAECDPRLQDVLNTAIQYIDFSVVCGRRGKAAQRAAYLSGASRVDWPDSKHNAEPPDLSMAADLELCPAPAKNEEHLRYCFLAGIVYAIASQLGYKVRWGGNWDRDAYLLDQTFYDLGHFELED